MNEEEIQEYIKKNLKIMITSHIERERFGHHMGMYDYNKNVIEVSLTLKGEIISEDKIVFKS